jgi:hypothetical protein
METAQEPLFCDNGILRSYGIGFGGRIFHVLALSIPQRQKPGGVPGSGTTAAE